MLETWEGQCRKAGLIKWLWCSRHAVKYRVDMYVYLSSDMQGSNARTPLLRVVQICIVCVDLCTVDSRDYHLI